MAEILATNIKALRSHMKLDQTEFGELVGVSQATIARWEKDSKPRPEHLMKMVDLAGCSLQDFMGRIWSASASRRRSPIPRPQDDYGAVMMPVLLPNEADLADMFRSLLEIVANEPDRVAAARTLAQLLPDALAQTIAVQSNRPRDPAEPDPPGEGPQPPAKDDHAPRPRPRT